MRRKPLQRGRRKSDPIDVGLQKRYWKAAISRGGCVMCKLFPVPADARNGRGPDFRRIEAHHVLAKRHLRQWGFHDRLWDTRNGIALCRYHHGQHEAGMQRVPYELLPDDALEFAIELELDWIIEREYPGAPA